MSDLERLLVLSGVLKQIGEALVLPALCFALVAYPLAALIRAHHRRP